MILSATYIPLIATRLASGVSTYYLVYSIILLVLALPLLIAGRGSIGGLSASPVGALAAGVAYLLMILLAWGIGALGGPPDIGAYGVASLALYSFSTSLLLAAGLTQLLERVNDHDIASLAGGLTLSVIAGLTTIASGRGALATASIMVANYGLGYMLAREIREHGILSSTIMYGLLLTLLFTGPLSIGGGLMIGGMIVAVGGIAGWHIAKLSLNPPNIEYRERFSKVSRAKLAAALILIGAAAGGIAYLHSENVVFWRPYAIVTGSMEPAIARGDLVLLEKVNPGEIEVGDIITFREGRTPITHRVYSISEDGVIHTKGDANAQVDPYSIHASDVIGRVKYKIPHLGWLFILLNWNTLVRQVILWGSIAAVSIAVLTSISSKEDH